jgi:hypothetical protein
MTCQEADNQKEKTGLTLFAIYFILSCVLGAMTGGIVLLVLVPLFYWYWFTAMPPKHIRCPDCPDAAAFKVSSNRFQCSECKKVV